jgi:hypothetical protein
MFLGFLDLNVLDFLDPKPHQHQSNLASLTVAKGIVVSEFPYLNPEGKMALSSAFQWSSGMGLEITKEVFHSLVETLCRILELLDGRHSNQPTRWIFSAF